MRDEFRANGDAYQVSIEEVECFRRDGFVHLPGLLSADEITEVEEIYERFMKREIEVPGKDFCDMSGDYHRPVDEFAIVNVMLPRKYAASLRDSVYERRAASVAEQLCGADMVLDYDQFIAKRPQREDAVFAWHQDLAYWPDTPDTRTASFWLAIDDSTVANGCMHFVPGSHHEQVLRPHRSALGDRGESHTLVAEIAPDDELRPVEIARGDVTVHNERVIHGSRGNATTRWRRAYVVAYRSRSTVEAERRMGFTHSHNDPREVLDGER
jgi:phytanoyl-CoA hydroxylase